MSFIAIAKATQIAAALSSIALAKRRAEHMPAAVALVVLTAIALARGPLSAALAPLPRPIEGAARSLVYLDGAAELATYATIAGLALAVAVSAEHRRRARSRLASALVGGSGTARRGGRHRPCRRSDRGCAPQ